MKINKISHFALLLLIVASYSSCKKKCPVVDPINTNEPISLSLKPDAAKGKDTEIATNAFHADTLVHGTTPYMAAEVWTSGSFSQTQRGLIDFDLSAIPSGAKISKATLVLYADTTEIIHGGGTKANNGHNTTSGSNAWVVKRITSNWDESTVTWISQPTTDNTSIINMPASTSRSETYSVDVTQFITDQLASPSKYYGFMYNLLNESAYRSVVFCTSDHQYSSLHPELNITYTK